MRYRAGTVSIKMLYCERLRFVKGPVCKRRKVCIVSIEIQYRDTGLRYRRNSGIFRVTVPFLKRIIIGMFTGKSAADFSNALNMLWLFVYSETCLERPHCNRKCPSGSSIYPYHTTRTLINILCTSQWHSKRGACTK